MRRSDEERMLAVARGDLDAFSELVLSHQRSAWNVAFRFLHDSTEAEDVVQDAFLKILDAAPRYRPMASFRTYLYQIVSRLCIDRAEKKHPEYSDNLPDAPDPHPPPSEQLFAREREEQVQRALGALPPNQRIAVILKHFEDLSYAEIAQTMGTSVKAVEGLLGRARSILQNRLASLKKE